MRIPLSVRMIVFCLMLTACSGRNTAVPTPIWDFDTLLNQAAGQAPFTLLVPDGSKLPFEIEHTGLDLLPGVKPEPFVVSQLYRTQGSGVRITQSSQTGESPAKVVEEAPVRGVVGYWVVLNTGERVLYWEENGSSLTIGGDLADEEVLILAGALVPFDRQRLSTAIPSPTPDLSPYYGDRPPAATLIVDGHEQAAGVGTATWLVEKRGRKNRSSMGMPLPLSPPPNRWSLPLPLPPRSGCPSRSLRPPCGTGSPRPPRSFATDPPYEKPSTGGG